MVPTRQLNSVSNGPEAFFDADLRPSVDPEYPSFSCFLGDAVGELDGQLRSAAVVRFLLACPKSHVPNAAQAPPKPPGQPVRKIAGENVAGGSQCHPNFLCVVELLYPPARVAAAACGRKCECEGSRYCVGWEYAPEAPFEPEVDRKIALTVTRTCGKILFVTDLVNRRLWYNATKASQPHAGQHFHTVFSIRGLDRQGIYADHRIYGVEYKSRDRPPRIIDINPPRYWYRIFASVRVEIAEPRELSNLGLSRTSSWRAQRKGLLNGLSWRACVEAFWRLFFLSLQASPPF